MTTISYKQYEIHSACQQLVDSREWTTRAFITLHKGRETAEKEVSAANTFKTEAEAIARSLEFGKRVIDGQVPGCTVDDL